MHTFPKQIRYLLFIFTSFFLLSIGACKFRQKVSLIVHHATIYTVDKNFSIQEAMAINDGKIVAVQQENIIGTSFHPELSGDNRMHKLFIELIAKWKKANNQ